jgi:hypothetical protein
MANTPIYGFETPDDTDLVKDGALSIRTALGDVDTTLGTALNSNDYAGLVLVKKQTVGNGVSSVTVTGAFNATYENYKIIYNGGTSSAATFIRLQLGASNSLYYGSYIHASYATANSIFSANVNNGASFLYAGGADVNVTSLNCDLLSPFLTKFSTLTSGTVSYSTNRGSFFCTHESNTSFTAFTISPNSGTLTGGTIYVYGYGAS